MARYIDADTLYVNVKADCNPYGKPTINFDDGCKVLDMIRRTPAADVAPVIHAHWIEKHYVELKGTGLYAILGTCSNCKCEVITDESAEYCSNCGAVMDEEEPHEMCFDFEKTFHGAKMDEVTE